MQGEAPPEQRKAESAALAYREDDYAASMVAGFAQNSIHFGSEGEYFGEVARRRR
jgi:hypothetical protein